MTPQETYSKYLAKLKFGCEHIKTIATALSQTSQLATKDDIDARIQAADRAIHFLQDVKRAMLYFRNKLE